MYLSKQEWLNAEKQTDEVENHLLNLAYTILRMCPMKKKLLQGF